MCTEPWVLQHLTLGYCELTTTRMVVCIAHWLSTGEEQLLPSKMRSLQTSFPTCSPHSGMTIILGTYVLLCLWHFYSHPPGSGHDKHHKFSGKWKCCRLRNTGPVTCNGLACYRWHSPIHTDVRVGIIAPCLLPNGENTWSILLILNWMLSLYNSKIYIHGNLYLPSLYGLTNNLQW